MPEQSLPHQPANTVTVDLWPPELGENMLLLSGLPVCGTLLWQLTN